jgi:hypothetical protein
MPEPKVKTIPITRAASGSGTKTRDMIRTKVVETEPE